MLFSLPGAAILDFVWNAAVYRPTVVGIEGEKVHRPKNSALHGCQPSPRTVKLHVAADVARTYVFVRWRAAPGGDSAEGAQSLSDHVKGGQTGMSTLLLQDREQ